MAWEKRGGGTGGSGRASNWDELVGKPASSPAQIDEAVNQVAQKANVSDVYLRSVIDVLLGAKATLEHGHTAAQISDFTTAVQAIIDTLKGVTIASLDGNGVLPLAQLPAQVKETRVVADIAARNALTAYEGLFVYVLNASADASVGTGSASYIVDSSGMYHIVAKGAELTAVLDWNQIQNIPAELFGAVSHVSDATKHITPEERAAWNNKVSKVNGVAPDENGNVTITAGGGGAVIDDTTPFPTKVYSSQKVESLVASTPAKAQVWKANSALKEGFVQDSQQLYYAFADYTTGVTLAGDVTSGKLKPLGSVAGTGSQFKTLIKLSGAANDTKEANLSKAIYTPDKDCQAYIQEVGQTGQTKIAATFDNGTESSFKYDARFTEFVNGVMQTKTLYLSTPVPTVDSNSGKFAQITIDSTVLSGYKTVEKVEVI